MCRRVEVSQINAKVFNRPRPPVMAWEPASPNRVAVGVGRNWDFEGAAREQAKADAAVAAVEAKALAAKAKVAADALAEDVAADEAWWSNYMEKKAEHEAEVEAEKAREAAEERASWGAKGGLD